MSRPWRKRRGAFAPMSRRACPAPTRCSDVPSSARSSAASRARSTSCSAISAGSPDRRFPRHRRGAGAAALGCHMGRHPARRRQGDRHADADRHERHGRSGRHGLALGRRRRLRVHRRGHDCGRDGGARCRRRDRRCGRQRGGRRAGDGGLADSRAGVAGDRCNRACRRGRYRVHRVGPRPAAGAHPEPAPGWHGRGLPVLGTVGAPGRYARVGAPAGRRARHRDGLFHDRRRDRERHPERRHGHGGRGLYRGPAPRDRRRDGGGPRARGARHLDQQRRRR